MLLPRDASAPTAGVDHRRDHAMPSRWPAPAARVLAPWHAGHRPDASRLDAADLPRNRLLDVLPPGEYEALAARLEPVTLDADQVLERRGLPIAHVYFPETAVAVRQLDAGDGAPGELAPVGRFGVVGVSLALGDEVARQRTVVRLPGRARRLDAADFRDALATLPSLRPLVACFANALLHQLAQAASCGRSHRVDQRLATLLLCLRDQSGADQLSLTHEHLAAMLGTRRRASVTESARMLRSRGAVGLRRRRLVIRDPGVLLAAACACYGPLREHAERPTAVAVPDGRPHGGPNVETV